MTQTKNGRKQLAIIGAGPKALAIAAKADVLKRLGFDVPELMIFEKHSVAHHWRASSGLTNGQLTLGTSPDKDVGFPYYSFSWGDVANRKINHLMQDFSWQNYLVANHEFADWIDRGKPAPIHHEWAAYLEWVFQKLERDLCYIEAEVKELDVRDGRWLVKAQTGSGEHIERTADGVVITGPGEARLPAETPTHPRVLTVTDFWRNFKTYALMEGKSVALVGAGETAATVAAALGAANPNISLDIISPQAMTFSRGESYAENHVYTDPFQANWLQLTRQDRRNFVSRTDRGVFSISAKQELDRLRNVEIIPGLFTGVTVDSLDQLLVRIEYDSDRETRIYDYLIISTGFDHLGFVKRLLSGKAREEIASHLSVNELTNLVVEDRMDRFLSVEGLQPFLHLPMMAGMNQGPGFPNLSCLGRLSDHVLARYVPAESVAHMEHPLVTGAEGLETV